MTLGLVTDDGPSRRANSSAGRLPPQWTAAAEQRLRAIWHTALDAFLVVDDERRYVFVNTPATHLLGAPAEQVLGRRIDDFTAREDRPLLESLWTELKSEGKQEGAYEVLRHDGSRTMAEYRATWNFGPGQHLIAAREIGPPRSGPPVAGWSPLTPREREVLQLVADGRSPGEIAQALYLSPHTVRSHLQHIHAKLGVRDRASAVAVALRRGLID